MPQRWQITAPQVAATHNLKNMKYVSKTEFPYLRLLGIIGLGEGFILHFGVGSELLEVKPTLSPGQILPHSPSSTLMHARQ